MKHCQKIVLKFYQQILLICLIFPLAACSSLNLKDEYASWTAEKFYTDAKAELSKGNWQSAIKMFERLEAKFPYGRFAQQAQIETAYAYWKNGEPASALATCDRFLRMHPNHKASDYVLYLKGVVGFNEDLGIGSLITQQDPSRRDPKPIREAFESYSELVKRFPESPYAADARQRMKYLLNTLANYELSIAKHYMSREAYLAAVNRAQYSIKTYPEATANEEALYIVVQAYDKLALHDLRDDALRVLKNNFPQSSFLANLNKISKN